MQVSPDILNFEGVLTSSGYEATGFFPGDRQPTSTGRPSIQLILFNSLLGSVMSEDRLRALKSRINLNYKVGQSSAVVMMMMSYGGDGDDDVMLLSYNSNFQYCY